MPVELGIHSERLRAVRALLEPRGRRDQGRYALEGPTLLAEARRSGLAVRELFATAAAQARHPIVGELERAGTPTFLIPERAAARLSDLETPSGIVAVLDLPAPDLDAVLALPGPVLLLAAVADPGNAGTLIRSAEAFGAAAVIAGAGGADPFAPKAVRAAMGSSLRLPVVVADAAAVHRAAAASERPIALADLSGRDVRDVVWPENVILAVGNERRGATAWLGTWDFAVRIPQPGPAESLNAAVAGSIVLYEIARGRARSPQPPT